jgi:hypothetical protein
MNTNDMVVEIDAEISRLQQAKALLAGTDTTVKRKPGRPAAASSPNKATSFNPTEFTKTPQKRRILSADTRAKIAEAQKKRWAETRKAEKKAARKTASAPTKKAATKKTIARKTVKKAVATKRAPQPNAVPPTTSAS